MKVLVAIEDFLISKLVSNIVKKHYVDCEINQVFSFHEIKELLNIDKKFDLIIVYTELKEASLLEVVAYFRNEAKIFCPILLVSDISIPDFIKRAYYIGVNSVIFIPFSEEDLIGEIKKYV